MKLTHLSLFTGIGGLDLAAEWAGFTTVGQCEFADYPYKVLCKHWPDVHKWRDIRTLTGSDFYEQTDLRTVDVISGGFPCQPFSVAGKQKGKEDNRYLWPEMLRVVREIHPTYIIGENVPGILHIAADDVCKDMEREGYEVGIFNYEAAAVGAKHRRERFFFVGHTKHDGQFTEQKLRGNEAASDQRRQEEPHEAGKLAGTDRPTYESSVCRGENGGKRDVSDPNSTTGFNVCRSQFQGTSQPESCNSSGNVSNSDSARLQVTRLESEIKPVSAENRTQYNCSNVPDTNNRRGNVRRNGEFSTTSTTDGKRSNNRQGTPEHVTGQWWSVEPNVGRVANGIPSRVDRLKCLGNAVVPQQAYPIFKAIAEIEMGCAYDP